jgi:thymidylate synthase ThyX
MRKIMGTEANQEMKILSEIHRGVSGIEVEMIDWPNDPYRAIYDMVTATWGNERYEEKWSNTSIEGRKFVLSAALTNQTLSQALEAFSFTFRVKGTSRSSFDQIARARIGAAFASMGVRDNNRLDAGFRMPKEIWENIKLRNKVIHHFHDTKVLYAEIMESGKSSWQSARSILPMGMTHNFYMTINYLALKGQCARRLMFCEQPDTVAVFWKIWDLVYRNFPILGAHLLPACDQAKKCLYHQAYSLSEAFSCLFKGCGRWPSPEDRNVSYFQFPSCTKEDILMDISEVRIPEPDEWTKLQEESWLKDQGWKGDCKS